MCTLEQSPHINNYEYEPRAEEGVSVPLRHIFILWAPTRACEQPQSIIYVNWIYYKYMNNTETTSC